MSFILRLELSSPGNQILMGNHQLFNVIATAHAILMVFFLVKINFNNIPQYNLLLSNNNNNSKIINSIEIKSNTNNINPQSGFMHPKSLINNYTKININNLKENKRLFSKLLKNEKGVYLFKKEDTDELLYVGHSINLYNRVSSYFMPSILNLQTRKVLKYFNKYGYDNIYLEIYILSSLLILNNDKNSLNSIINLEQYFIDNYKPVLNIDLIAKGSGTHSGMSEEWRLKFKELRGIPIFIYNIKDLKLLYIFESKTDIYKKINIHHVTLKKCLESDSLYLNKFKLSLDLIIEGINNKNELLNELDLVNLINMNKSLNNLSNNDRNKKILALFKDNPNNNKLYNSISELVKDLKGDRSTILKHINNKNNNNKLYRGKWKFILLK